jgi:hypothetical protein
VLLSRIVLTPLELGRFTGPGEIHTDDNGVLEFAAQRDFYYAVSSHAQGGKLQSEVARELRPRAALETLAIDLGQGAARDRRAAEIAQELERSGRSEQARIWREKARIAPASSG